MMTWGKTLNENAQEPCYRAVVFYIIPKAALLSEKHEQGSAQPLFWEVSSSPDLDACSLFWNTAALFLMVRLWLFWARKISCGYEVLNWRNGKLSQMHATRDGPLMQKLPLSPAKCRKEGSGCITGGHSCRVLFRVRWLVRCRSRTFGRC